MDINDAWLKTCKVLLGRELGPLEGYAGYLMRHVYPQSHVPSALSGRTVSVSDQEFCKGARFMSHDEMSEYPRLVSSMPLHINEIKDIDSAVSALGERFYYCGDMVLGNSSNVRMSDRCTNASCIYRSREVYDGKFVAYTSLTRFSDYVFGGNAVGESSFSIKGYETFRHTRCMETIRTYNSGDCYFTASLDGCTNCMFSFNLRNRSYCVGNLQLPKDRYAELKSKLVGEIADTLEARKVMSGIVELLSGGAK